MRKPLVVLVLVLCSAASLATEMVEVTALKGRIILQAPAAFSPMPDDILAIKYPASQRPTEVLSDETGGVTLAFKHSTNIMSPAQVKEAHVVISKMFHNLHPSATWIRDEVIVKHGQAFMVMELITPAVDTQIHNIIYGTSVEGRFLLVAFNTTVEQSEKWLPIGKKMMNSMRVVD